MGLGLLGLATACWVKARTSVLGGTSRVIPRPVAGRSFATGTPSVGLARATGTWSGADTTNAGAAVAARGAAVGAGVV